MDLNLLTPQQTTLRDSIRLAFDRRRDADVQYQELRQQCNSHVFVNVSDDAHCAVCGQNGGWYCPDSPDHVCHYDQNECCTFCGDPEERK